MGNHSRLWDPSERKIAATRFASTIADLLCLHARRIVAVRAVPAPLQAIQPYRCAESAPNPSRILR